MNYLGKKLSSFSGDALSGINETIQRKRREGNTKTMQQSETPTRQEGPPTRSPRELLQELRNGTARTHQFSNRSMLAKVSPLAGGFAFGGDSIQQYPGYVAPPPIGFRTDLLSVDTTTAADQQPQASETRETNQTRPVSGSTINRSGQFVESTQSLYEGDTWTRIWFQRVMILSLLRLLLFIRKVYEDYHATKTYRSSGQTGHFLIAAATLFLPTVVFTIYRVARYLQISLPPLRLMRAIEQQVHSPQASTTTTEAARSSSRKDRQQPDDEHQLTRALMSSPTSIESGPLQQVAASSPTAPADDNDGLVTARQTPTIEEFHDSTSQQESAIDLASAATQRGLKDPEQQEQQACVRRLKLESVNVDKLGDLPDKETTRVVIGASEQLLHGVMFIFWQLKRQVDVLGYLVERACLWRKPHELEKVELDRMRTGSDGLEWFQDFYAAFLAILAQVYTLALHWSSDMPIKGSVAQLGSATSGLGNSPAGAGGDGLSISHAAQTLSNALGQRALAGSELDGRELLIMSELVVSSAVVLSLLVAVRRRDDGPLTLALSMLGWGSLFSARIIAIALAFVHIGWQIMLPLVILQVLAITGWIYKIALDSHNDRPSERADEAKWDQEAQAEVSEALELEQQQKQGKAGNSNEPTSEPSDDTRRVQVSSSTRMPTSSWSVMEHLTLLAQILTLFAIPSLFYWPIMFNLKLNARPFKYLLMILIQNFLLIPAIWFSLPESQTTAGQLYLLGAVGAFSIVGFIFVSLYVACKPSLTEYFARADELFNEAEKSGIYYEFCSRVFKMPDLSRHSFRRLMDQTEEVVEEQYVEVRPGEQREPNDEIRPED